MPGSCWFPTQSRRAQPPAQLLRRPSSHHRSKSVPAPLVLCKLPATERPGQESQQHALLCPRLWKRCCRSGVGLRVCRSQSSPGCPDFWSSFEDHTLSSWAGEAPGEIPGTPGSLPEGPTAGGTVIQLPCVCKPSSRVCVCVCVCVLACMCVCARVHVPVHIYVFNSTPACLSV